VTEYESRFLKWKEKAGSEELQRELLGLDKNVVELQDRFYKDLEFGTGGMRGIIGVGSNRINIYTVRRTIQGLANYLNRVAPTSKNQAVIAYDSRHKSREFALEAALVLAKNQIKSYLFCEITPTPLLSFAVRELGAQTGIVITASHNTKEYNGLKVYNCQGGQITDELANIITAEINQIADEFAIETATQEEAEQQGLLVWLHDEILTKYLDNTVRLVLNEKLIRKSAGNLNIVYSPLYGTGLVSVTRLFEKIGFTGLHIVTEQANADPDFPTLICPNPEEEAACVVALEQATRTDADLILLTDPDADRIGVVVKAQDGSFLQLTGNQTGALLIDYILRTKQQSRTIPANGIIIKTIVTSDMGAEIAAKYGVGSLEVLTGFKYIGEKITEFETSHEYTYLFGYEESYGYLIGDFVRDKDAIQTSLCIAEMALYHKINGSSLYQRLQDLFEEFGYYREHLLNTYFAGPLGPHKIEEIIGSFRKNPPPAIQKHGIVTIRDYLTGIATDFQSGTQTRLSFLPSNTIYYNLKDGAWCCIRPSGTEPKLKIYLGVRGKTASNAQRQLEELKTSLLSIIKPYQE